MKKMSLCTALLGACIATIAQAGSLPDDHAPISIMGDHNHKTGEFMLSYRYMRMGMEGVRFNDNNSSAAAARTQYMMSPIKAHGNMHMVGGMYGLNDQITLTLMGCFIERDMTIQNGVGGLIRRSVRGIGDTKVGAVSEIYHSGTQQHHHEKNNQRNSDAVYLVTNVSLPTGNHDIRDDGRVVGYPMRLGTGTFDPTLGLTYVGKRESFSFGAQGLGTFRLYDNDLGYHVGNLYQANLWGQVPINDAFSASLSLNAFHQEEIEGADRNVNPNMAFVFDPSAQKRQAVDLGVGLNFVVPSGSLQGQRLAIETSTPIYEKINGYGLERDYRLTAGWQYAF